MTSSFAALVNSAYVLAGIALFVTNEAPVISPSANFLADRFSVAWAGWKFSGCLYMALVNFGVGLGPASALTMVPYIAFDVYAAHYNPQHWTPLAYSFIVLEMFTAITALGGYLKVGGVINALYVLAGVALFATGEAPVVQPDVVFHANSFAVAWAGWKFAGCFFYAMVNLGLDKGLSLALAMVPYVVFDVYAVRDPTHWTPLAGSFILLDGLMGVVGFYAYMSGTPKTKGA